MLEKHTFKNFFKDFMVLISSDETDLFRYFNRTELQQYNFDDAIKSIKTGEVYIDAFCSISPINDKPFIFLNQKSMNELPMWKTASKIMSCTNRLSVLIHNDTIDSEMYANQIMERLNFPKIFFMYEQNTSK